jgi:MOSC domain-containing protein YiiM
VQINTSPGGVPKRPVSGPARVTELGIVGDGVRHPGIHGGPSRALCLFFQEVIDLLRAEGHPIQRGDVGENLVLEGVDYRSLQAGMRLALGPEVEIELTKPTEPCKNIAAAFSDGRFKRIDAARHPGEHRWYARVLRAGALSAGDAVRLI